jgi:hypothetical protein
MSLQLRDAEQAWLDAYREALNEQHPGAVQVMLIYDSKARGQAHAESDLDVLLIIKNDAAGLKKSCDGSAICSRRKPMSCRLFSPIRKRSGRAEGEADQVFAKPSSATQCASYEPEHGLGRVEPSSGISSSSGDFDP